MNQNNTANVEGQARSVHYRIDKTYTGTWLDRHVCYMLLVGWPVWTILDIYSRDLYPKPMVDHRYGLLICVAFFNHVDSYNKQNDGRHCWVPQSVVQAYKCPTSPVHGFPKDKHGCMHARVCVCVCGMCYSTYNYVNVMNSSIRNRYVFVLNN